VSRQLRPFLSSTWPQLLWLVDPNDYLKPFVFEVKDE
jgi:hypothetical protein